nr:hypothetical protein Iba_chr01aCG2160 [Ipomoea batatas]
MKPSKSTFYAPLSPLELPDEYEDFHHRILALPQLQSSAAMTSVAAIHHQIVGKQRDDTHSNAESDSGGARSVKANGRAGSGDENAGCGGKRSPAPPRTCPYHGITGPSSSLTEIKRRGVGDRGRITRDGDRGGITRDDMTDIITAPFAKLQVDCDGALAACSCKTRWMHTADGNFLVTLYAIPLVSQEEAIDGGGLRDIVSGYRLIREAQKNIRCELAAHYGNV